MKLLILILLSFNLLAVEIIINSSLSEKEIKDIETNILKIESDKYKSHIWKDPLSGLMWEDDERQITKLSFQAASDYCKHLNLKSFTDWRLPTSDELIFLVDYTQDLPQPRAGLKYISTIAYISSTKYHKQNWNTRAFTRVYLDNGNTDYYLTLQGHSMSVRCVRQ